MIELPPERIAQEAGAEVVRRGAAVSPERAVVDSRETRAGDLFVGLAGEHADGGAFAADALAAGAWGVLVDPGRAGSVEGEGWVLAAGDPLVALQALARAWRRELDRPVVGITGSTGKTSTKDICRALVADRVHASPENYNTEVGLPLAILSASAEAEVVVLEMAMRGAGQIAELCAIAEPDVAVVTNVGPVHLELLGTIEAIRAAKAEIVAGLRPGGTAVIPVDAGYLEGGGDLRTLRFGDDGDVAAREVRVDGESTQALIAAPGGQRRFVWPFTERHNLENALAAVAAGVAVGATLDEMVERAPRIVFSRLRGELVRLGDGVVLVNDCYNANPMSMRAALDHLSSLGAPGRLIAVLGEMRELGPEAERYHREIGEHARAVGVDVVLGVGELAGAYAPDERAENARAAAVRLTELVGSGDAILVKGSRALGLEGVAEELLRRRSDGVWGGVPPEGPAG